MIGRKRKTEENDNFIKENKIPVPSPSKKKRKKEIKKKEKRKKERNEKKNELNRRLKDEEFLSKNERKITKKEI